MSDATSYTLVYENNTAEKPSVQEFMNMLEKGDVETKIDTMRRILTTMLNGDPMPQLLMQVIRFVMPEKNKELKKLLQFYWEVCPKLQPDGKLKQEMILVCNAIRNDLQHPNEYIRGSTLRFLPKLKEPDLFEPLIPTVRACLDHRHSYVRKYAVFCVYSIFQMHSQLIPDANELIRDFLINETDATCKRNAFVSLSNVDRNEAYQYLVQYSNQIANMESLLQLAFVEFIRKDAMAHPENKPAYLEIIFDVLESSSNATIYDAANVLTSLTSNSTAIQAAAKKFLELASKESDNNVKLIVLDRVDQLRAKYPGVLDDLIMDILYILSSSDLDVRKKAFEIGLNMVSSKNVDDVVKLLKKELQKTVNGSDYDKNNEYRELLIGAMHQCAVQFDHVAENVVDMVLDLLNDFETPAAFQTITLVKDVVEIYPNLQKASVHRLMEALQHVESSTVYRDGLWIVGEYCTDEESINDAWKHIRKSIGQMPILSSEQQSIESGEPEQVKNEDGVKAHAPKILADGTYATESAFSATPDPRALERAKNNRPPLRALILSGTYFLGAVLATTLTKLVLRFDKLSSDVKQKNSNRAEALLIMTSILRVGESGVFSSKIDEDSVDRILTCIRALAEGVGSEVERAFLEDSHNAFSKLVKDEQVKKAELKADAKQKNATQVDSPIKFRQLAVAEGDVVSQEEDELDSSVQEEQVSSRLNRIAQLTGFSDAVYAEAYVMVHQFDIVLDVLLFNQTNETLQNLSVEFATLGDLKVVERPTTQNVGPQSFHSIQTTIKVSSADAGVIFGNIVYEGKSASENNIVILNDVHIDIMDYIKPGHCTENEFRNMWSEFEWENKVNITVGAWNTLQEFLSYLMKNTNMTCLTAGAMPETDDNEEFHDDCQFLSANLHARSSFGEDALANLSIEKSSSGKITGHVRIRSKGQGLALSLGDRIADLQRKQQQAVVIA